jgi:hypothetical protein
MRNNRTCHKLTHMRWGTVAALLIGLTFETVSPLAAATLRCPPRLPGPHPGFEQIGPLPTAHWLLWRMQVFDLPPNKGNPTELLPAPATVRHDAFTLNWRPTSTDDMQIACLYNGSGTTYQARLHPPPTACTLQNYDGRAQGWCETP